MKSVLILAVLFFVQLSFAGQLTVEEKTLDFQQLIGRVKSSYGPLDYKKSIQKIDIDQLQTSYLQKIQNSITNEEFYYLINQFVAEFKDSHFAAIIPTDVRSSLPFTVELVQNKVLIDAPAKPMQPNTEAFPFKKGDELVSINGVPVQDIMKDLSKYVGQGSDKTLRRVMAYALTSRRAARLPVQTGTVTIAVKQQDTATILSKDFTWDQTGTAIPESLESIKKGPSYLATLSIKENLDSILGAQTENSYRCSGTTRIAIPEGATLVSTVPFVSYYYPTAKGNVGYVRIPHYSPPGETAEFAISQNFSQYEKVIGIMEKNTVGLVIDQDHNCGGYVELVNKLAGLFMNKPYRPMYFKLVANKENYFEYKNYVAELDPLTTWFDMTQKVSELLKTTWQKGVRMTDFTSLDGQEWLAPNLTVYTKPIVMTIDELSGSGGDAFPSMLQGYGRVKLIGTRTMGAGGHVSSNSPLNYSQINVSMTRSLFFRPDGVPVENNGAVPDYPYEITTDDFINGYKGYREFYTQKLLEMIK